MSPEGHLSKLREAEGLIRLVENPGASPLPPALPLGRRSSWVAAAGSNGLPAACRVETGQDDAREIKTRDHLDTGHTGHMNQSRSNHESTMNQPLISL